MRSSVVEDVFFSNPGVSGRGLNNLLHHTSLFQQRFPGSRFRINWSRQQNGRALAEWIQLNQDSSEFLTADSYARLNEEGRIVHFAGFCSSKHNAEFGCGPFETIGVLRVSVDLGTIRVVNFNLTSIISC